MLQQVTPPPEHKQLPVGPSNKPQTQVSKQKSPPRSQTPPSTSKSHTHLDLRLSPKDHQMPPISSCSSSLSNNLMTQPCNSNSRIDATIYVQPRLIVLAVEVLRLRYSCVGVSESSDRWDRRFEQDLRVRPMAVDASFGAFHYDALTINTAFLPDCAVAGT